MDLTNISSILSNLVESQKTALVTALISIPSVLLGALVTYYFTEIQRAKQLKEMRLYPLLISASAGILHALEPFTNESKREHFSPELFLYHIEDSLINYQQLISGEGIVALLSKKKKMNY